MTRLRLHHKTSIVVGLLFCYLPTMKKAKQTVEDKIDKSKAKLATFVRPEPVYQYLDMCVDQFGNCFSAAKDKATTKAERRRALQYFLQQPQDTF